MEEQDAMHARRKTGEALLSCIHLLGGFNRLGTEDQGEQDRLNRLADRLQALNPHFFSAEPGNENYDATNDRAAMLHQYRESVPESGWSDMHFIQQVRVPSTKFVADSMSCTTQHSFGLVSCYACVSIADS